MPETVTAEMVRAAVNGDETSLNTLIRSVQDGVYGLAVRMLWHPEDARDATQEILIRMVTHLGSFRGESAFMTWVYRIATNHLLNVKKSRLELQDYSFERFGAELDQGLTDPADSASPEQALLIEEVKIGCTLGMLTCLDRPHRLAYILGEILEMEGPEASSILDVSPVTFRKRLSRARAGITEFTRRKCGLVNPANTCHCSKRVTTALADGRITPKNLLFAGHSGGAVKEQVEQQIEKLEQVRRIAAIYRSHPAWKAPADFLAALRQLVQNAV